MSDPAIDLEGVAKFTSETEHMAELLVCLSMRANDLYRLSNCREGIHVGLINLPSLL